MNNDSKSRAEQCAEIAIRVGYTRDGGHVIYLADEANQRPEGATHEARRALRDAIACAVRSGPVAKRQVWTPDEIAGAVDIVCEYAKVDRAQYLVMPAPGYYSSMDRMHPVRGGVHDNAADALRMARRRRDWGVIKIDGRVQSPPWLGWELDRLHREGGVSEE